MKELVRTIHVNGDRGLSKRRHYLTTCISDVMLQTHRDVLVKIKLDNFHHQFIFSLTYSNQQCLNYKISTFRIAPIARGGHTSARTHTQIHKKLLCCKHISALRRNFHAFNVVGIYCERPFYTHIAFAKLARVTNDT